MDIIGTNGNDTLIGGIGDDTLDGGDGNDVLYTHGGNDYLNGGIGDDNLVDYDYYTNYDSSQDTLVGGLGNDSYKISINYSGTINEDVNAGTDTVVSHGSGSYTLADNLENLYLELLPLNGRPRVETASGIGNGLNNIITGRANYIYSLFGEAGDDYVSSSYSNDTLYGGIGNDTLDTRAGDDYLYGDDGNDSLLGGDGNDFLAGNIGSDTLTGGSNADTFVFNCSSEGIDSITDFNYLEQDKIQVSTSGFGIGENRYEKFTFSSDVLYFDQIALASLQPASGFDISRDITFV